MKHDDEKLSRILPQDTQDREFPPSNQVNALKKHYKTL